MPRLRSFETIVILFAMLLLTQVAAQTQVTIVIKDGAVQSMDPSQLYMDTDYVVNVKVVDKSGNPVTGSLVEFVPASGLLTIDGTSSAKTGSDGTASLPLKFTSAGVLSLYVGGAKAKTLNVYYSTFPAGAAIFIVGTLVIIGLALAYTVYKGPIKTLRK